MKDKSAIIPYRFKNEVLEILLIKNKDNTKWVIPKGTIEETLKPSISATKEAYEEAGVLGIPLPIIVGSYNKNNQQVPTYLLKVLVVLDEYLESELRDREWHKVDTLSDAIVDDDLLLLVKQSAKIIQKNGSYFKSAVLGFCLNDDITLIDLNKKEASFKFQHKEKGDFKIEVKRKKQFVHFSLDSDFIFKSKEDIPQKLMLNLMLDNTKSIMGYWSLKQVPQGFVFTRMFNEDLHVLYKGLMYTILEYLILHCSQLKASIIQEDNNV